MLNYSSMFVRTRSIKKKQRDFWHTIFLVQWWRTWNSSLLVYILAWSLMSWENWTVDWSHRKCREKSNWTKWTQSKNRSSGRSLQVIIQKTGIPSQVGWNHYFFHILISAGIGRTGCFIAISNGIKQLNHERSVDIVRILCQLRQDRGGMIQTDDQYRFVYRTLSIYARISTWNQKSNI